MDRTPKKFILMFVALIIAIQPSLAVNLISGNDVVIDHEISDSIVSGGRVTVISPVNGDLIIAGGEITINSPVYGDVIASGGRVEINGDVHGKILSAGGEIRINGEVGKFVLLAGGNIIIGRNSKIHDDVFIAGGQITNSGYIEGNLTAIGGEYSGSGIVTGNEYFKKARLFPWYFFEVITAGFLVLGIISLYIYPELFQACYERTTTGYKQVLLSLIAGGIGLTIFLIAGILLLFTLIGTATGIMLILLAIILISLSNLITSYSIGGIILRNKSKNNYVWMLFGFIILYALTKIPYIGGLVLTVSTLVGSGTVILLFIDRGKKKQLQSGDH